MKFPSKLIFVTLLFAVSTNAYAQFPTPADRAFVAKVSQGGMFEVAAGRLAMTKGSTQDIKDFAAAEVHDHTLVGDKLKRISSHVGISLMPGLNPEFSAKLKHLSTLSGPAFDNTYMSIMAMIHDMDGAAFAQEAAKSSIQSYRSFGAETHRIVLRHIGAIKAIPAGQ